MSLAENLLNSLDETAYQNSRIAGIQPEEEHIIVGQDRTITVPNSLKTIAVKGDKDIETVTFDCVRYWDGHDLSTFAIYINYILPTAEEETTYIPKEITKFEDTFSFDWTIGREITSIEGSLKFWIVAKLTDDEGNLIKQWSSLQNSDCSIASGGDKIYVPEVQTDKDVISQAISVSRNNAERAEAAAKKAEETADLDLVELPQEWFDINEAYEAIKEDDHKLLGGAIYKDFEGNVRAFPLAPPYGIRTDEVGEEYAQSSIAMYNSKQQLLVKPATDGRHTVSLQQLDKFFGGKDSNSEKTFSIERVQPVNTTLPIDEREPYVFCRDSNNKFSGKKYSTLAKASNLVERDEYGRIYAKAPDSTATPSGNNVVNVDYFDRIVSDAVKNELKKYLAKSGGTMTGKPEIKTSNPAVKFTDTSDSNSVSYIQAYQGKTAMGYSFAKSISVDKNGNAGVPANLTVGGSISCTDIDDLKRRLNALADSDDITLDQLSEIVAYIKSNKSLIDSITTSKVNVSDIVNNLNSDVANKPLSAAQGFALKQTIDRLTLESGSVTSVNGKVGDVELSASDVGTVNSNYVFELEGRLFALEPASEGLIFSKGGNFAQLSSLGDFSGLNVRIPDSFEGLSVEGISQNCFRDNARIEKVFVPNTVNEILARTFENCTNLKSVIARGAEKIGTSTFEGCENLLYVDISNATTIGSAAFRNCRSLTSINIPDSVTTIEDQETFMRCVSLKNVRIGRGITRLSKYMFGECESLKSIIIPDEVTDMSSSVFYKCSSLNSITIGSGVTHMGMNTFGNCTNLKHIYYNGTMEQWNSITKDNWWDQNTNNYTVYCTDGNITKS